MSGERRAGDDLVVVVMPTYNERANIESIVEQVLAAADVRIIVVDDASPDGTGAIADRLAAAHPSRVSVVHRRDRRGLGAALVDGWRAGLAAGAAVICQMDADGSHDPRDLPALIAATAEADLVIGSRYIPGAAVTAWPISRRLLSRAANLYMRTVLDLRVRDVTAGFRAWRAGALGQLDFDRLQSQGHAIQAETAYATARAGLRIRECPIRFRDRRHGLSKVRTRTVLESLAVAPRLRWAAREALSLPARMTLGAAVALVSVEAMSLIDRGAAGLSDIGVFYRTSALLRAGERQIYPRADAATGWPVSMPPLGFAIFQPFSRLDPWGASVGWAAFNLILLAVCVGVQARILARTREARYRRIWPWTAALLLVLSAGSVQVGQFSVLFVTCWLLFLEAFGAGAVPRGVVWLAVPAAIKVYPTGLLAIPLSLQVHGTPRRRVVRAVAGTCAWFAGAVLVLWFVVPAVAYGVDAFALNGSWWQGVILNNAQMNYLQDLRAISNQSLDTVLLRYLSYDPVFHDHYPLVPHFSLAKDAVLRVADVARAIIVIVSAAAVWRGATTRSPSPARVIDIAALWTAALYNVLPETKSRYAVYLFVAFLPWVARAADPTVPAMARFRFAAVVLIGTICALVVLPDMLQAWGVGVIGPLMLWVGNVVFVAGAERQREARGCHPWRSSDAMPRSSQG